MKNLSIRTRILAGVVLINMVGAIVVMVYLHQSFSSGLDTTVNHTSTQGLAAWEQIKGVDTKIDPTTDPQNVVRILDGMKEITGADYGLMLDKTVVDQKAFDAARETLGLPSDWDEGDTYALLVATDETAGDRMKFNVPPTEVPENGKIIGVENGACSKACHNGVTGSGDYWTVRWSTDRKSRGHSVFPVFGSGADPIGVVYSIADISAQADSAKKSTIQTLLVVAITLLVSTLTIGMLMDLWVLRRLARMTDSMQDISMRVAGGDFSAEFTPDGTTDEIGSFEKFYSDFIHLVSATLKQLSGQK